MGFIRTISICKRVRRLIDASKYPYNKDYRIAMQRILTKEEWGRLNKKERYFNSNKGKTYKVKGVMEWLV